MTENTPQDRNFDWVKVRHEADTRERFRGAEGGWPSGTRGLGPPRSRGSWSMSNRPR